MPCYQATVTETASSPAQPLVGATVGPSSRWLTVSEWSLLTIHPKVRWSGSCHVESEVRGKSRASVQWVGRGALGTGGGCGCRAPEPSHWPGPGLEAAVNLSLPLQANGSGCLSGSQSVGPCLLGPCLCRVAGLRSLGTSCVLGAWLPQWWWLDKVWGLGPEGTANWALPPLSQDLDLGGWGLSLGTCLSLSEQRRFVWWRFTGTSLPDYDLTSRTKGLTPRNLQQPTTPLPHLSRKGLCW